MWVPDLTHRYRRTALASFPLPSRQELLGLGLGLGLLALYLALVSSLVPVRFPVMAPGYHGLAWGIVFLCGLLIATGDALVLWRISSDYRRPATGGVYVQRIGLPTPLALRALPVPVVLVTLLASLGLAAGALLMALPLWTLVLFGLLPWLPLYALEARWKAQHFGVYLLFEVLVVLQLGHLGEHLAQNFQLLVTHGDISRSHGVFGMLDIEAVHFWWDEAIWVLTGVLLTFYWRGNFWLWASWIFASFHALEHAYMMFWRVFDPAVYYAGGIDGILGQGGLMGTALARPYLHLAYNVLVIGCGCLAFLAVSRRVYVRTQSE